MPSAATRYEHSVPYHCKGIHTFQEAHGAVQTLRTELIVTEGAEQLADQDVDLFGHSQSSHVAKYELYFVTPL